MKYTIPLDIVKLEAKSYHIFIDLTVSGKPCRLLLDTGASKTVLDAERALQFVKEHNIKSNEIKSVGLGVSDMETRTATLRDISIRKFTCKKIEVAILPLGHVNTTYESLKIPAIDGVLGSDFLVKYDAVIDFGKSQLKLYKK